MALSILITSSYYILLFANLMYGSHGRSQEFRCAGALRDEVRFGVLNGMGSAQGDISPSAEDF